MAEKNLVVKAADAFGRAVGTFQRARALAKHGATREQVVGGLVESGRYQTMDYSARPAQRRAIQSSWVFIAITKVAQEFAASTFEVVKHSGQPEDKDTPIKNHPLERLLNIRPNPYMGAAFFWEYLAWWLELNGNAYIYIGVNKLGQVEELWPLPAFDIEPQPGDEERFIDHYLYTAQGSQFQIPAEYVVHVKFPNPFDIFRGLSPLVAAMVAVDTDTGMSRWNASFFNQDNVMPSAVINLSSGNPERPISPTDATALKDDLKADYQAHRRKTAITTAYKIEVEQLGWSPREMDFTEGRQFTKEEIFNIYGVPVALLSADATYSNSENAYKVMKDNVWPVMVLVAEQITVELVQPFYGMDEAGRFQDIRVGNREMELNEVQAADNYLTTNEIRADYWNKEPLPNGRGKFTGRESLALEATLSSIYEGDSPNEAAGAPSNGTARLVDRPKREGGDALPARRKRLLSSGKDPDQTDQGQQQEEELLIEEEAKEDLKRWKRKALNYLKSQRALPIYFVSSWIPDDTMRRIRLRLFSLNSRQPDALDTEVKALFDSEANLLFPFVSVRAGER